MPIFDDNTNVEPGTLKPRWLLRRQGHRAVRVFERHKQQPAIGAFEQTLPPAVEAFNAIDEALGAQEAALSAAEKPNTEALRRVLRASLGLLDRDLPGFSPAAFAPRAGVADDVVDNAGRVLQVLRQHVALPYAEQVGAELTRLIEAAEAEIEQGQAALAALQELRHQGRRAAAVLQKELVAFRRALRAVLGASHRDHQKLRDKRAFDGDEDDGVVDEAPVATSATASAAIGTARTSSPPALAAVTSAGNGAPRSSTSG